MALNADQVIKLSIAFLLFAVLGTMAVDTLINYEWTTQPTGPLWTVISVLLPLLFVIGIAVRYIPKMGDR